MLLKARTLGSQSGATDVINYCDLEVQVRNASGGKKLGLKHFKPIKPLGCGDTGSVHLVQLRGSEQVFAMKAMDKAVMLDRNKVHRVCAERQILDLMDHPFLPTLYASFQVQFRMN